MSADSLDDPGTDLVLGSPVSRDEDFPGCESFHLPASGIDRYEGRLEFWDGGAETAWKVCEPTSIQHEGPSRRLVQMATRFEIVRGSRIACFGSADLVHRDAAGGKRWLMQADELLYLRPDRVRLQGPAIDIDRDPLPEVVLEVDHTTDVRRRKLDICKESGFPEIRVLVPWDSSVRAPGLAIHVRRGAGYCEAGESRAFPGWKAEEVDRALTEDPMSETAWRALERTALAMGAREGTKPEHDPLTRSLSARVQAQGDREGHARGCMEMVTAALRARGIEAALDFTEDRELFRGLSADALMAAALASTGEADFRRTVRLLLDARQSDASPWSKEGGAHGTVIPHNTGTRGQALVRGPRAAAWRCAAALAGGGPGGRLSRLRVVPPAGERD